MLLREGGDGPLRSERLPRSLPSGDEVWGCGWRRDVSSKRNGILAESKRKALGDRPVTSATMQDPRENVTRKKLPAPGNRRQSSRAVVGGGQFQAAACMRPVQPLPAPPNPQGSLVHEPRRGSGVWGQLGHLGGGRVNACGLGRDSGPRHGEGAGSQGAGLWRRVEPGGADRLPQHRAPGRWPGVSAPAASASRPQTGRSDVCPTLLS